MRNDLSNVNEINDLQHVESYMRRSKGLYIKMFSEKLQLSDKVIKRLQREVQNEDKLKKRNEHRHRLIVDRYFKVVKLENEYKRLEKELQQQTEAFQQQIEDKRKQLHKGLSPARIQQFQQFLADESLAGDRCAVCLNDIEMGRRMMRLDCHHVFCKDCVEGW